MSYTAETRPLTGRAALVTGGSRGIGAAVALRLAADGADVALTYLSAADRARQVVRGIEAVGVRGLAVAADAGDPAAVRAAVERAAAHFGRLDILVNNAGVAPFGALEEVTVEDFDHVTAVHGRAAFVAAQAAAPHMRDGGRIITVGSNLGERVPAAGMTLYAMSKSALLGLTRGLARDLGPRGITANLVQPGSTDTELNPAGAAEADAERALAALGRYCSPEDIAAMVAHLAGPGGRSTTGASLLVDAGANA